MRKIKPNSWKPNQKTSCVFAQLMLDETCGFRIPERRAGLTVNELVNIRWKIERVLRTPTRPLVDTTKAL
jgi:hypothetical protein